MLVHLSRLSTTLEGADCKVDTVVEEIEFVGYLSNATRNSKYRKHRNLRWQPSCRLSG